MSAIPIPSGGVSVKLASLVVHLEEYRDTGSAFDLAAAMGLLHDDVLEWKGSFLPVLLPLRRDGKS